MDRLGQNYWEQRLSSSTIIPVAYNKGMCTCRHFCGHFQGLYWYLEVANKWLLVSVLYKPVDTYDSHPTLSRYWHCNNYGGKWESKFIWTQHQNKTACADFSNVVAERRSCAHDVSNAMFHWTALLWLRVELCVMTQQNATFWGLHTPAGAMTPNSNSAEIFVQCTSPKVSRSHIYSFGSYRVDTQTHKQTDPAENVRSSLHYHIGYSWNCLNDAGLLTLSPPIPLQLYTLPYLSEPPFLIFAIRALWRGTLALRQWPNVKN